MDFENHQVVDMPVNGTDLHTKPILPDYDPTAITFDDDIFSGKNKPSPKSKEKNEYEPVENLKEFLSQLDKRKFILDCGHKVTFGYFLGNNVMILNGKELKCICSDCAY